MAGLGPHSLLKMYIKGNLDIVRSVKFVNHFLNCYLVLDYVTPTTMYNASLHIITQSNPTGQSTTATFSKIKRKTVAKSTP